MSMFMRRRVLPLLAPGFTLAVCVSVQASDAPLVDAAAGQDAAGVRALLDAGADVNTPRADGATALLWAAHWDDLEMVELLLRAGADPNAADDHGVTPLMRAGENASPVVVEALLDAGADPDTIQTSGLTSLMIAARTGNRDVVRALLAHGADVNAVTHETGVSALMWAVAAPHPDIVHVLLETGADVEASSAKGFTPLLFAVLNGDVEQAQALLAAGADINGTGSDGTHPLPLAIVSRQAAMAHFLLEQGADPNGRIHGVSALHAAAGRVGTWLADWYRERGMRAGSVSGGGRQGMSLAARTPLVRELLARGADPNARIDTSAVILNYLASPRRGAFEQNSVGTGDVRGATPLWVAAYSANGGGLFGDDSRYQYESNPDVLGELLAAGADPNARTADGTTPLMMAAGLGYRSYQPHTPRGRPAPPVEEAVRVLVEGGADVNARNEADFTALHAATFRGLNEVIEYLVEQGADIDARDFRGRTAFRMAEGAKQSFQFQAFPETAEFLRQLGANTRLGIPGDVHERADRAVVEENAQRTEAGGP